MPPIFDDLKDKLPEAVNPAPAVEQLSKNQSAALYIISLCIAVPLLGIIIWLAISDSNGTKKDKEAAILEYKEQIAQLRRSDTLNNNIIKSQADIIRDLEDSLKQINFINQFNAVHGTKQIILTPKK